MKRHRSYIDKRLNWRDPNMPVIDDGIEKTPEQFQKARIRYLEATQSAAGQRHFPHWNSDPSYNWRKKKK